MLSRVCVVASLRGVRATSFGVPLSQQGPKAPQMCLAALMPIRLAAAPAPLPVHQEIFMPTPQLDETPAEDKSMGTGVPRNPGRRKPQVWNRKNQVFRRQYTLNLLRQSKGPSTPTFKDGVPFKMIRRFIQFSPGFHVKTGLRRKVRNSLKRGRRRLK